MDKIKIIVAGAAGRMGKAILSLAAQDEAVVVSGAFERADHPAIGQEAGSIIGVPNMQVPIHPDLRECVKGGDVVIDFSTVESTLANLEIVVTEKKSMVIGTTGLDAKALAVIKEASEKVPIVQAPNMSVGVNLIFRIAELVAEKLDERYDVEIVEEHHRYKKDAPSGTALEIARLIAKARKIHLDQKAVYGRQGMTGARDKGAIGIHAVRGGDTIGYHQVAFLADGERLELVHRATSRDAFAYGALQAAKFVAKKKNGLFNMQQVLGL